MSRRHAAEKREVLPDAKYGEELMACVILKPGAEPLDPADRQRITSAMHSYARRYDEEFGQVHDSVMLIGQDNLRRYLPVPAVRIRVHPGDTPFEIVARICAAVTVGCHVTISRAPGANQPILDKLDRMTQEWGGEIEFVSESDAELAEMIRHHQTERDQHKLDEYLTSVRDVEKRIERGRADKSKADERAAAADAGQRRPHRQDRAVAGRRPGGDDGARVPRAARRGRPPGGARATRRRPGVRAATRRQCRRAAGLREVRGGHDRLPRTRVR